MFDVRRSSVAAFGGVVAAALALAACGGGSSHSAAPIPAASSTTTTAGGRGAFGSQLVAFRDCMSSHGVTVATRPRNRAGNGGPPSSTPGATRPADGGGAGGRGGGGGFFGGGNFAARFANPPAGDSAADAAKYRTAYDACKSTLPPAPNLQNNSAFQAYRSCLQDHGVTLPANGTGSGLDRNDPKVRAATSACRALLPAGGFGRATTTTTTVPA